MVGFGPIAAGPVAATPAPSNVKILAAGLYPAMATGRPAGLSVPQSVPAGFTNNGAANSALAAALSRVKACA